MLKLFVISDLHGVFPAGLRGRIMEEEPDVVVCCGDVTPFRLRDDYFEHVYGSDEDKPLWEYIGKKWFKAATRKDFADAHHVLGVLDDLPFPVRFVPGNVDRTIWRKEDTERSNHDWAWPDKDYLYPFLDDLVGVKDISYGADIIGDYVLLGYPSSSFPGRVQSDPYRRHRRWLDNAFRTFEWEKHKDKTKLLVSHNGPYDTKTDMITSEDADESVQGEHYGSKLARRIIERYQPRLCVHGHIEEGRGTDMIGDTKIVNVGEGKSGNYGLVEVDEDMMVSLKRA